MVVCGHMCVRVHACTRVLFVHELLWHDAGSNATGLCKRGLKRMTALPSSINCTESYPSSLAAHTTRYDKEAVRQGSCT